jgi:hypothetical protein
MLILSVLGLSLFCLFQINKKTGKQKISCLKKKGKELLKGQLNVDRRKE